MNGKVTCPLCGDVMYQEEYSNHLDLHDLLAIMKELSV